APSIPPPSTEVIPSEPPRRRVEGPAFAFPASCLPPPAPCGRFSFPMKKLLLIAALATIASAQHLVKQPTFDAIANEYSGERAQEHIRAIVEYHRIQGSPMMSAVAENVVLPRLKAIGIESSIEQLPSDGKTKYGTFTSPMGWDMRGGELWVEAAL